MEEVGHGGNETVFSVMAVLRQEWRVCAGFAVVAAVAMIEPGWAFFAVRLIGAGIYAVLLAVSS